MESFCVCTKTNPFPKHNDFGTKFYKFPSYLRRAAIAEALGKVSSYRSNLRNWEQEEPQTRGKRPGYPRAGFVYTAMYRDNMYVRVSNYSAEVKVFIRNTWDWVTVTLNKGDVDYILHHCINRRECVPTLQKRGRKWFLDFGFKKTCILRDTPLMESTILAVDLGINNACVCSAMKADSTVIGRRFLSLPKEKDSLQHAVNLIK